MSNTLEGKTLFITGASRGIGKAIALRAARDDAQLPRRPVEENGEHAGDDQLAVDYEAVACRVILADRGRRERRPVVVELPSWRPSVPAAASQLAQPP